MARGPFALVFLLVGLAQGAASWALYHAADRQAWPWTVPALFVALAHFVAAAPLAWYFLQRTLAKPVAAIAHAVAIALLLAALGAHGVNSAADGSRYGPPSFAFASAIMAYVLVSLAGAFDPATRRFDYARLFDFAWRNVFVGASAGALTGVLWALLWAGAWMMGAIGIQAPSTLLREPLAIALVSAGAFGFAVDAALRRADAVIAVKRFWLALNSWFLPLALVLALVWLVSLAVMGTQPLFATKRAASYLFWFAALAILFMNAAFQDGTTAAPYPRRLAIAVRWAWFAMPVLACIGLWALGLRVHQYGWTVERIWAAFVGGLAVVYAGGYAVGSLRGQGWMAAVAPTNIAGAIVLCLGIAALVSPLADARRLAVSDQLARLRDGRTAPSGFDFQFLKLHSGRYGAEALQHLAAATNTDEAVRSLAARALVADRDRLTREDTAQALAMLRSRLRVLPEGATADPKLIEWLARPYPDYNERLCIADPSRCALWIVELDRAPPAEALLLVEDHGYTTGTVYALEAEGWRRQGMFSGGPVIATWIDAIRAGQAAPAEPKWPEIRLGQSRYRIQ